MVSTRFGEERAFLKVVLGRRRMVFQVDSLGESAWGELRDAPGIVKVVRRRRRRRGRRREREDQVQVCYLSPLSQVHC